MKKILFIIVIFLALAGCSKKDDPQVECVQCQSIWDHDGTHIKTYCGMPDEVDAFVKKTEWIDLNGQKQWYCKKEK
jgi:nitrous oxide reductase accessory protein NosL